jgi:hypothetical protein
LDPGKDTSSDFFFIFILNIQYLFCDFVLLVCEKSIRIREVISEPDASLTFEFYSKQAETRKTSFAHSVFEFSDQQQIKNYETCAAK